MAKLQAIRGMHDILMQETPRWRHLEETITKILISYGYQELRLPIVEKTELFSQSIGSTTDIVFKEMYTFHDRNDDSLTLRPEGTAGCVRAGIEHGLFHNQTQRLWYMGPMFRHERPQKGRQRQFHQIGVEAVGMAGPDIDAEIIMLCVRLWHALNISDVQLEINSLGTSASRQNYRRQLVDYFSDCKDQLDEDSLVRLEQNPLRILDSKNPALQPVIQAAPSLTDSLDAESSEHFDELKQLLDAADIPYRVNPRLVRGLDYYDKTVFEWCTDQLGAQGTVCAGGRYDGLIERHGGTAVPATGFAIGLERLLELCDFSTVPDSQAPHAYILLSDQSATATGLQLAEELRSQIKDIRLITHCGGGSFKSQFKKADKSGAQIALVLGDDEIQRNEVSVKFLRNDKPQITVSRSELAGFLKENIPTP